MFSFIVTVPVWAAKPSLEQISAETLENGSPYGDSIRVSFDQPMKNTLPDFRINHNVPIPQAPAGYRNDAYQSARLAAKNYLGFKQQRKQSLSSWGYDQSDDSIDHC